MISVLTDTGSQTRAHRQAPGTWEAAAALMGPTKCYNLYHLLRLALGTSTGLTPAMNGRSRTLRALAQEGRCVSVCLGLPLFSEAGSRRPIPCPLLAQPPAQTMEAHSRLCTASSLTPPGCGHSPHIAPESLRLASRSSAEPSLLTRDKWISSCEAFSRKAQDTQPCPQVTLGEQRGNK